MSNNPLSTQPSSSDEPTQATDHPDPSAEELTAQLDLLAEENARLRSEYQRARQVKYQRTAIGFVICGVLAGLAGLLFPAEQTVLFALAGTGVFAAILIYYLTPERFVAAAVSEQVYTATADWGDTLQSELGLQETPIYVPVETTVEDRGAPVRLFLPQHTDYSLDDSRSLDTGFVIPEDETGRGLALQPTGATLYAEFESQTSGIPETPSEISSQLTDGLVESFELAETVTFEVDSDRSGLTFAITGSSFGAVGRFDHPIQSFLAVGLAVGLNQPITVEQQSVDADDDRFDYRIHCSWDSAESSRT